MPPNQVMCSGSRGETTCSGRQNRNQVEEGFIAIRDSLSPRKGHRQCTTRWSVRVQRTRTERQPKVSQLVTLGTSLRLKLAPGIPECGQPCKEGSFGACGVQPQTFAVYLRAPSRARQYPSLACTASSNSSLERCHKKLHESHQHRCSIAQKLLK